MRMLTARRLRSRENGKGSWRVPVKPWRKDVSTARIRSRTSFRWTVFCARTPEFGEIRYRYAQAHINEGERALEEGDLELARGEAKLVLELKGHHLEAAAGREAVDEKRSRTPVPSRSAAKSRPLSDAGAQNR